MNIRDKADAKREILELLNEYDLILQSLLADAPMTYTPSCSRNAETRRFDNSQNQRKQAAQLGLQHAELVDQPTMALAA